MTLTLGTVYFKGRGHSNAHIENPLTVHQFFCILHLYRQWLLNAKFDLESVSMVQRPNLQSTHTTNICFRIIYNFVLLSWIWITVVYDMKMCHDL